MHTIKYKDKDLQELNHCVCLDSIPIKISTSCLLCNLLPLKLRPRMASSKYHLNNLVSPEVYIVDVVEWSRALDVRLSEWCCSVSMV